MFALCWGIFATVLGGLLVSDHHGFARWFLRNAEASTAGLRRVPPWRWLPEQRQQASSLLIIRVIGGFFAAVGSVALLLGVVFIANGHAGSLFTRGQRVDGVAAFIYLAGATLTLIQFWRPGGVLSAAWHEGRTGVRALAILSTATAVGTVAALWQGFLTLAVVAFAIGGLSTLAMVFPHLPGVGFLDSEGDEQGTAGPHDDYPA